MCGITGVLNTDGVPVPYGLIKNMSDAIAHRGPDGEGAFCEGPVGLGHRRLAILDLSNAGAQPMGTADGSVILVFNGEIYNYQRLKIELARKGHQFQSQTDTEALLYSYVEWGAACVERFNGMFAFAIWDKRKNQIFLARDRFGVKPLYWAMCGETFIFGSEIKSILKHPAYHKKVSLQTLNEYMSFQNSFGERTLFEGIYTLNPGSTLTLEARSGRKPKIEQYWDYNLWSSDHSMSEESCVEELRSSMVRSVVRQLQSDVPVGAYLSGGIDSGALTAIAARELPRLTTFTVGFDLSSASGLELVFDERARAETLSNLFKTEHYEAVLHAGDMEWVLPRLIWHLEDLRVGQCYPNYYVARLASKFVKVVLSGVGGDELFAGYPWRYFRGLDSKNWDEYLLNYYSFWQRLVPDSDKSALFNRKTAKEIGDLSVFGTFKNVFSGWKGKLDDLEDYVNASLYFELKTFLHGLLIVEDKLSMAHSLESRVPFLDNDLVDLALKIPISMKLKNLQRGPALDENLVGKRLLPDAGSSDGKQVLRKAAARIMPPSVTERVKQGFSAPDASWFRGESIDYINDRLRSPRAQIYEFFEPKYVENVLDEHCSGRTNKRLLIWSLISLEEWMRRFF